MTNSEARFLGLSQFVHHHLLWLLIGAYAIAAIYPAVGLLIRNTSFGASHISLLMVMLALLMFNAGLGVKTTHLKRLKEKTLLLVAGLTANVAIPIAYIFAVTLALQYWYESAEAQYILVGLALVAAMPIAGASTAWAQNSNDNLALSLGLVLFSTVLSPIVTPVDLHIFGEMASDQFEEVLHGVAAYGSAGFLGLWVVLPSLLGLSVRFLVRESWLTEVMPYVKLVNSLDLLLLNYSNASVSLPQIIADPDWDFLIVTLVITTGLCLTSYSSGYVLSRLFKLDEAERVSLMYGLGMSNNGTGLVLASLALSSYPRVLVPIICYNLVQHLVAGTLHLVTDKSPKKVAR